MWFIVMLIASVLGGPPSAIRLEVPITTYDECQIERDRVQDQLDAAYPAEEHALYTLKCVFFPFKA